MQKEIEEIKRKPKDLSEWCDVIILALDGAWRQGFTPYEICKGLIAKQAKNFERNWGDAVNKPDDEPVEHVREKHETLATEELRVTAIAWDVYIKDDLAGMINRRAAEHFCAENFKGSKPRFSTYSQALAWIIKSHQEEETS